MKIRNSTKKDLENILNWLKEEDELNIEGCFYCNRRIIKESHCEGSLFVLLENDKSIPLAYMATYESEINILEVYYKNRRKGYGKILASHFIEIKKESTIPIIKVQCNPDSSIPFWKKLGFSMYEDRFSNYTPQEDNNYGFLLLEKNFELPTNKKNVDVEIRFYSENKLHGKSGKNVLPLSVYRPKAVWLEDDEILLEERVIFFCPRIVRPFNGDLVIEVLVDSQSIFLDKCKRDEAFELGLDTEDGEAYFMDEIILDQSLLTKTHSIQNKRPR